METVSSNKQARSKSLKIPRRNLPYYAVHLVLVTIVTLPTIFYVFQPDHPPHSNLNGTTLAKSEGIINLNQTSSRGLPVECNSPLVLDQESVQCRPPCAWTTQSPLTQKVYYGVVVVGFWLVLIATVITFITWASIRNLRKFPHVLRFHIMVCCILLACCKMIPIRIGLGKTFCREQLYWQPTGHSSLAVKLQGATSHYFGLAHSFWAMCFIANTYAVIVHDRRGVFKHPIKFHLMQSVLCWLGPAVIVAGCLFFASPGYRFLFVDLMAAGTESSKVTYFAVTLPMQVTLAVSLCLLWSIVWHLRKARLDSTKRVIRAREERVSMRRIERQFLSMAVVMLLLVGVVLSINTVIIYRVRNFIHETEVYFHCLQTSTNCKSPRYNTVLPLINLVAPGFLCLAFFFLLLMNRDCRRIWKGCFATCNKIVELCKPPPRKLRAETDRSRCSSTLTVLPDRRDSEPYADNRIDLLDPTKRKRSYLFPRHVTRLKLKGKRRRSSTSSLPAVSPKKPVSERNSEIDILVTPPPNELGGRSRSHSAPVFPLEETNLNVNVNVNERNNTAILSTNPRAENALECSISEGSEVNSETDTFIRETEECSSTL